MSERRRSKMRNKHDPYEGVTGKDRQRLDVFLGWRDQTPVIAEVEAQPIKVSEHPPGEIPDAAIGVPKQRKRGFKGGRRGAA